MTKEVKHNNTKIIADLLFKGVIKETSTVIVNSKVNGVIEIKAERK